VTRDSAARQADIVLPVFFRKNWQSAFWLLNPQKSAIDFSCWFGFLRICGGFVGWNPLNDVGFGRENTQFCKIARKKAKTMAKKTKANLEMEKESAWLDFGFAFWHN